jgi:hypothetical protein
MRKLTIVLALLLLPISAFAQGVVTVAGILGRVDLKGAGGAKFTSMQPSTQIVHVGDQIRTGPGGTVTLTLPDMSYMVITENSNVTIQDFWTSNYRNIVDVMMGKVRFYIQKLGGKPNPYRVQTPTALIAVRGTIFEVTSYDPRLTEVSCLEGSVTVETVGLPDREVILEAGKHTMVQPGVPPIMPIAMNESLIQNRVIPVVRKDGNDPMLTGSNAPSGDRLLRDNDRSNRALDPMLQGSRSTTSSDVQRAKPSATLRYPEH